MENEVNVTRKASASKDSVQLIRDIGASLLSLPAYVEHFCIKSGASPAEVVRITATLRFLCSALIKNDNDAVRIQCRELEIALIESQKERMKEIPDLTKS